MHIVDGALSKQIMVVTNLAAAGAVGYGLSKLDFERVPRVGVLASAFFIASFIHVKIGPSSVHLILNGLLGFLLGWGAFPALAAALFLQAVLLGFGGVTSLGANILIQGIPAVLCYGLFALPARHVRSPRRVFALGAAAGATGVLGSCFLLAALLHASSPTHYATAIKAIVLMHLPIAAVEAVVVGSAAAFLHRVRPDLLAAPMRTPQKPTQEK